MKGSLLKSLNAARMERKPAALITRIQDGSQTLFVENRVFAGPELDHSIELELKNAILSDKSRIIGDGENRVFIHVFNPSKRLVIVGAVHIAQSLAPMAYTAGYDVSVIDPRSPFATAERFPNVKIFCKWPDEVMPELDIDRRTAIVTLTHDPKIDDPALTCALNSDAFYIGSLGSRNTHASRIERLQEAGLNRNQIARINGPVGLNIKAILPAEIAVSILAQIIECSHLPNREKDA
ncbi:MAG: XdhC family protein [Pseudomonadota bacterium]|nr:XdhC family protein [Pseudomonadota bacterium]